MGSANPMSVQAPRLAAMEDSPIVAAALRKQGFEDHNPSLFLVLALLYRGSVLVTLKNTEVSTGLEAWRGLQRCG